MNVQSSDCLADIRTTMLTKSVCVARKRSERICLKWRRKMGCGQDREFPVHPNDLSDEGQGCIINTTAASS